MNSTISTNEQSLGRRLFLFLGSMNLAISLLVTIALASVIGTILKQNEPFQNYIVKFGPFWHEIYKTLGLYDVYSSAWFISILAFLVISTSICITRNTPKMLRSMQRFQLDVQEQSLLNFPANFRYATTTPYENVYRDMKIYLEHLGYRFRHQIHGDGYIIAAMKGMSNRLGYIFTHCAIVIICIGGLLDGNLPLKLKTLTGKLEIETRDIPLSQIPASSRLGAENPSFRANVSIPEGSGSSSAFINVGNGYLVQRLPFNIQVSDFRIEHYPTGQPKSFESDLIIIDTERNEKLEQTIAVNHPLTYRGYSIYQASFSDGGSRLEMSLRSITEPDQKLLHISASVHESVEVTSPRQVVHLELDDFRLFNIFEVEESGEKIFRNHGPSVTFKVRQTDGNAREFINYMLPMTVDGRLFMLSGMRSEVSEEFKYLHIPADDAGSVERFFRWLAFLYNDEKVDVLAKSLSEKNFSRSSADETALNSEVRDAMKQLIRLFRSSGFEGLQNFIERHIPPADQETATNAYIKVLQQALQEIYRGVLIEEKNYQQDYVLNDLDITFLNDAVTAVSALQRYGSPFFLQLDNFIHKQATGLQITRAPGKKWVYFGFLLLSIGVFLLFYVQQQRLWLIVTPNGAGTDILIAGTQLRHYQDFRQKFDKLINAIKKAYPAGNQVLSSQAGMDREI